MTTTRVLLADDHKVIRDLVRDLLGHEADFEVEEAGSLKEVTDAISASGTFDIVLLDYAMPGMGGLPGVEAVIKANAPAPVALFSGVDSEAVVTNAMEMGARGIIPKSSAANTIPDIIRFILTGETYVPQDLFTRTTGEDSGVKLSPREAEMLDALRQGMTNRAIARKYEISEATVKLHISTLTRKLGAKNRTQAVMIAETLDLF